MVFFMLIKEELLKEVGGDERLAFNRFDIVHPGDEVRIIPVKDVIEPRVKVEGNGGIFPGFISKLIQLDQVELMY